MTPEDWKQVKYFSHQDKQNLGDKDRYQPQLIFTVDKWREDTGTPFAITPYGGTLGSHSDESLHYEAQAIDFVIVNPWGYSILDIFLSLSRYPFTEIGVYPDWQHLGDKHGGFHVGLDPFQPLTVRPRKLWMYKERHGYMSLSQQNLELVSG